MENGTLKSFDRFAHTYGEYNVVQKKIIKKYLSFVKDRIVDLGCGSEGLCRYKNFEFYLGVDSSEEMLKRNPCNTLKADFNTKECFELIKKYDFDQIVSFSALQWSEDLNSVFREIRKLNKDYLLTVFTSNTFKSLHKFLGVKSPIFSKDEILKALKVLQPEFTQILNYEMSFKTPKELLEYIKYSGVGGSVKANPAKIRNFLKYFPVDYLEFEIIVAIKTSYNIYL
jgi:malonyl-CoA O-methyltransferase